MGVSTPHTPDPTVSVYVSVCLSFPCPLTAPSHGPRTQTTQDTIAENDLWETVLSRYVGSKGQTHITELETSAFTHRGKCSQGNGLSAKHLLCKLEDLHSGPQHSHKSWTQQNVSLIPALGSETSRSLEFTGQPV